MLQVLKVNARSHQYGSEERRRLVGKGREAEKEKIAGEVNTDKPTPTFTGPGAKRTNEDPYTICLN